MKPLAVDLCCGLGGWTDGLLAEGWDVVGFDIERHMYGDDHYPAQLVLQDIRTLDGRQFRGKVSLITASPPCQEFSYMAMPWSRAKAIAAEYRSGVRDTKKLTELFDACIRIGKEAECPIVIENVRGAQPWIGRARGRYGSFFIWGDVPALMPMTKRAANAAGHSMNKGDPKWNMHHKECVESAIKNTGGPWFAIGSPGQKETGRNPVHEATKIFGGCPAKEGAPCGDDSLFWCLGCPKRSAENGTKQGGDWFAEARKGGPGGTSASLGSKSPARKAASAMIAKIPAALARHIARTYYPA